MGNAVPNGYCWDGCGAEVPPGGFFVSGHDKRAESMVIAVEYGSIPEFLAAHGYSSSGPKTPIAVTRQRVQEPVRETFWSLSEKARAVVVEIARGVKSAGFIPQDELEKKLELQRGQLGGYTKAISRACAERAVRYFITRDTRTARFSMSADAADAALEEAAKNALPQQTP